MSSPAPVLPTFLIIGTTKAGTSTLYDVLKRHPRIFLPYRKELHFFNDDHNYARGLEWYAAFFKGAAGFPVRGDVTPAYLYWGDKVIPRIKAIYDRQPPPQMIVTLRDPVERAYSRYWHQRRVEDREPLSFEDALAAEDGRLRDDAHGLAVRGRFAQAYFKGGLYADQLAAYFDQFPRERFHVFLSHDLSTDFAGTIRGLLGFLGLDADIDLTPTRSNPASAMRASGLNRWLRSRRAIGRLVKRYAPDRGLSLVRKALRRPFLVPVSTPPMNPDTEQELRRRYLPDVRRLEILIGRDLSAWYPTDARPTPIRAI